MVFEAPQSELFRSKFHWLGSKTQNIPEFNLSILVRWSLYSKKDEKLNFTKWFGELHGCDFFDKINIFKLDLFWFELNGFQFYAH